MNMNVDIPPRTTPPHIKQKQKNQQKQNTKKTTKHLGALQRPWQLVRYIYHKSQKNVIYKPT